MNCKLKGFTFSLWIPGKVLYGTPGIIWSNSIAEEPRPTETEWSTQPRQCRTAGGDRPQIPISQQLAWGFLHDPMAPPQEYQMATTCLVLFRPPREPEMNVTAESWKKGWQPAIFLCSCCALFGFARNQWFHMSWMLQIWNEKQPSSSVPVDAI